MICHHSQTQGDRLPSRRKFLRRLPRLLLRVRLAAVRRIHGSAVLVVRLCGRMTIRISAAGRGGLSIATWAALALV